MESEETTGGFKQWVEDNLRLIVSIIIVVAIAGGIYSYSQRSKQTEIALNEDETQEQTLIGSDQDNEKASEGTEAQTEDAVKETTPDSKEAAKGSDAGSQSNEEEKKPEPKDETMKPKEDQNPTPPETVKKEEEKRQPQTSSAETSAETADSFVETAVRGDGTTHLARRALAVFLEKNPDSQLTPAHKIYIEDYVRKHVGQKGGLKIGMKVEFPKTLVQDAISKAKTLNEKQLKNLEKYAKRVPSLN